MSNTIESFVSYKFATIWGGCRFSHYVLEWIRIEEFKAKAVKLNFLDLRDKCTSARNRKGLCFELTKTVSDLRR